MSRVGSLHFGLGLLAVALLTASPALFADPKPVVPPGFKIVNIPAGGRTIPVLVKEQSDPLKSLGSPSNDGHYNPENIYSEKNAMADKKFDYSGDNNFQRSAITKDDGAFVTKTYQDPALATGSRYDTKANLPTAAAYTRSASGFDKSYPTGSADDQNRTSSFATSTSSYQNRAAVLDGPETAEGLAFSPMATKQYLGPGAQNVPAGYEIKENVVISRMSGLPNRPLSIDEVRNLINNGTKPDTDAPPAEPSKPLNDPNYKPEPDSNVPTRDEDDDKDDPVPPPGVISAPENAEPLPQK